MQKILLSLLFIPLIGFSQCPNIPITLSSQAEVDAFTANYPSCTELTNDLTISGSDIVDLTPLSGIISVDYNIRIENNVLLENLSGLNSITSTSGYELLINNNESLTDISALSNMSGTYILINIQDNPVLSSLNGLQMLDDIYVLRIDNNNSLVNLNGLSYAFSLEELYVTNNELLQNFDGIGGDYIQEINIENNPILNDISAIDSFTPVLEYFQVSIKNNSSLSNCNIDAVCSLINFCNSPENTCYNFEIENNAFDCNSILEVAFNCGFVPSNDECEGAIELIIGETTVAYNELSSESVQIPSCNDINRVDVWFTVNSGAYATLDILAEAGYSLQLWEGDCANLTQVANACAGNALTDVPVSTNTDYYVQVWSDSNARLATGLFNIIVQDGTLTMQEFTYKDFSIYPNPVNSLLNFKASTSIESVLIYNLIGQSVLESKPNSIQTVLDMSSLQIGMYLVKVTIGGQEVTYKVLKE